MDQAKTCAKFLFFAHFYLSLQFLRAISLIVGAWCDWCVCLRSTRLPFEQTIDDEKRKCSTQMIDWRQLAHSHSAHVNIGRSLETFSEFISKTKSISRENGKGHAQRWRRWSMRSARLVKNRRDDFVFSFRLMLMVRKYVHDRLFSPHNSIIADSILCCPCRHRPLIFAYMSRYYTYDCRHGINLCSMSHIVQVKKSRWFMAAAKWTEFRVSPTRPWSEKRWGKRQEGNKYAPWTWTIIAFVFAICRSDTQK